MMGEKKWCADAPVMTVCGWRFVNGWPAFLMRNLLFNILPSEIIKKA